MDRMTKGSPAEVTLNKTTYDGEVSYVASVAQPAGWWTGNVVKYDSIVQLPELEGLRPGMSAEVEIIFAKYFEELVIPLTPAFSLRIALLAGSNRENRSLGEQSSWEMGMRCLILLSTVCSLAMK